MFQPLTVTLTASINISRMNPTHLNTLNQVFKQTREHLAPSALFDNHPATEIISDEASVKRKWSLRLTCLFNFMLSICVSILGFTFIHLPNIFALIVYFYCSFVYTVLGWRKTEKFVNSIFLWWPWRSEKWCMCSLLPLEARMKMHPCVE